MKRPTKSEIESLVAAYGKNMYAARSGPFHVQQRLYDAFSRILDRLSKKYPNIDLLTGIEPFAQRWLDKQFKIGTGHWW